LGKKEKVGEGGGQVVNTTRCAFVGGTSADIYPNSSDKKGGGGRGRAAKKTKLPSSLPTKGKSKRTRWGLPGNRKKKGQVAKSMMMSKKPLKSEVQKRAQQGLLKGGLTPTST